MSKRFSLSLPCFLLLLSLGVQNGFSATWDFGSGANTYWGEATNWNGDIVPDGIGGTVSLGPNNGVVSFRTITLATDTGADASFTISSLTMTGNASNAYNVNNISGGSGAITFDASSGSASLNMTGAGSPTHRINVALILNDNLSITANGSGTREITKAISSGEGLTTGIVINAGTANPVPLALNLTAASTYTGATTINGANGTSNQTNGGILKITGNDRLPTTTVLTVQGGSNTSANASAANGGARFDLNNGNQTVAGLNGGGSTSPVLQYGIITNNASAAGVGTLRVSSTSVSSAFGGIIRDGANAQVALTKAGAGTTLTLTGANTYTGATTINGGTLLVNGSLAAGSAVAVNNSGILGGSGGTVAGIVTVNAGGVIAPGASIGVLNTGALSIGSAGTFALELDTTSAMADLLNVAGDFSLDLGNTSLLALSDLGSNAALSAGTVFTVLDYDGVWNGGLFAYNSLVLGDDAIFSFGANQYQISYNGLDGGTSALTLEVVAVPEPSMVALFTMGCAMFLLSLRRHHRRLAAV